MMSNQIAICQIEGWAFGMLMNLFKIRELFHKLGNQK